MVCQNQLTMGLIDTDKVMATAMKATTHESNAARVNDRTATMMAKIQTAKSLFCAISWAKMQSQFQQHKTRLKSSMQFHSGSGTSSSDHKTFCVEPH